MVGNRQEVDDRPATTVEPHLQQPFAPLGRDESGIGDETVTARKACEERIHPTRIVDQLRDIILTLRITEDELRNRFPPAIEDLAIGHTDHMQQDIIVSRIQMVAMTIPIGRTQMELDTTYPINGFGKEFISRIDPKPHLLEVRTGMQIVYPGIQDLYPAAIGRELREVREQGLLPDIMKEDLRHGEKKNQMVSINNFCLRVNITTPMISTTRVVRALYPRLNHENSPAPKAPYLKVSMIAVMGLSSMIR